MPKSNDCSSVPAPSFYTYAVAGGAIDRRRVTREEGTTSFSLALLNLPFQIESSKPLHYWYRGQIEGCSSSPADPLFMRQCDAAEKREARKLQASAQRLFSRCCLLLAGSKIYLSPLLPVSILIDSLLPSRKRLVRPLLSCIL